MSKATELKTAADLNASFQAAPRPNGSSMGSASWPATRSDFDEDESLRKQCVEIIRSKRTANDLRFAALLVATMDEWLKGPEMASINQRARIVHGAAFAAFKALAELLGSHAPSDTARFKDYLLRHCTAAVGLVRDRVNVNLFWRDLLDALASPLNPYGEGPDLLKLFHLTAVVPDPCPVTEHQLKAGAESSAFAGARGGEG